MDGKFFGKIEHLVSHAVVEHILVDEAKLIYSPMCDKESQIFKSEFFYALFSEGKEFGHTCFTISGFNNYREIKDFVERQALEFKQLLVLNKYLFVSVSYKKQEQHTDRLKSPLKKKSDISLNLFQ